MLLSKAYVERFILHIYIFVKLNKSEKFDQYIYTLF